MTFSYMQNLAYQQIYIVFVFFTSPLPLNRENIVLRSDALNFNED